MEGAAAGKVADIAQNYLRSNYPSSEIRKTFFGRQIYETIRPDLVQVKEMICYGNDGIKELRWAADTLTELLKRTGGVDLANSATLCESREWAKAKDKYRTARVNGENPVYRLRALSHDVFMRFIEVLADKSSGLPDDVAVRQGGTRTKLQIFLDICEGLFCHTFGQEEGARNNFSFGTEAMRIQTGLLEQLVDRALGRLCSDVRKPYLIESTKTVVRLILMCYSWLHSLDPVDQSASEYSVHNTLLKLLPCFFTGETCPPDFLEEIYGWQKIADPIYATMDSLAENVLSLYIQHSKPNSKPLPEEKSLTVCFDDVVAVSGSKLLEPSERQFLPDESSCISRVVIIGRIRTEAETGTRSLFVCTVEWVPLLPTIQGIRHIAFYDNEMISGIEARACGCQLMDNLVRVWVTGGPSSVKSCILLLNYDSGLGIIAPVNDTEDEPRLEKVFSLSGEIIGVVRTGDDGQNKARFLRKTATGDWKRIADIRNVSTSRAGGYISGGKEHLYGGKSSEFKIWHEMGGSGKGESYRVPVEKVATTVQHETRMLTVNTDGLIRDYTVAPDRRQPIGDQEPMEEDPHEPGTATGKVPVKDIQHCTAVIAGVEVFVVAQRRPMESADDTRNPGWESVVVPFS